MITEVERGRKGEGKRNGEKQRGEIWIRVMGGKDGEQVEKMGEKEKKAGDVWMEGVGGARK